MRRNSHSIRKEWRLAVIAGFFALFAAVVLLRYASLAIEGQKSQARAQSKVIERGRILDRNGNVLAFNIPKFNIAVRKNEIDPNRIAENLRAVSRVTGIPVLELEKKIRDSQQNFVYLAKRLDTETIRPLQERADKGELGGFLIEETSGRIYPEGRLASHLIGFAGEGNRGLEGVEYRYDKELSGAESEQARGSDVYLTIDARLQFALERIARNAYLEHKAESVFLLAMDVNTGEVLAYVQMPDFDPNNFGDSRESEREDRLSIYSYEPGSVFKVFSMASILDAGLITPRTTFYCDGAYHRTLSSGEKITIRCLHVHGTLDLAGILAQSCNAGVGYASDRIEAQAFYDRLRSFGFGQKTGAGSPGENPGSLSEPSKWSARTKPTIAIGQEVTVTALQMVTAASAVANGGILLMPQTVQRIRRADGADAYVHQPSALRRVIAPETSKAILSAMESAASLEGTGWRAKVADVRMAVKTGTAQMIDRKTRAYSDTDFIASTLGILPADNPRLAIYVAIVKPKGVSYLGGQIAAPVLRESAEAALGILAIPRGKSPPVLHDGVVTLEPWMPAQIGARMPNLKGYSKRQLLPLLLRSDIHVVIEGDGYVVSQIPEPGTPVEAGASILLRLQ